MKRFNIVFYTLYKPKLKDLIIYLLYKLLFYVSWLIKQIRWYLNKLSQKPSETAIITSSSFLFRMKRMLVKLRSIYNDYNGSGQLFYFVFVYTYQQFYLSFNE